MTGRYKERVLSIKLVPLISSLWKLEISAGGVVDHGYSLLGVLAADTGMGSNFTSCDMGSLGLVNVIIAGPTGEALEVCGPLDDTCFVS